MIAPARRWFGPLLAVALVAGVLSIAPGAASAAADDLAQLSGTAGCLQEPMPLNSNPDPTCAAGYAGSLPGPQRVAASADGELVVAGSAGALLVATRVPNGTLTKTKCFVQVATAACSAARGLEIPNWIRFTPDDAHVYVGSGDGSIAVFDRNSTTNVLTQPGGAAGCFTPSGASGCTQLVVGISRDGAFTPDGTNLYSVGDAGVTVLSRDTTTGALAKVGCVVDSSSGEDCLKVEHFSGANAVAVLTDASRVVVGLSNSTGNGGFENGGVWSFARASGGGLTFGSCLQEHATTQCAAATGVRNAESVVVAADGTVYEGGGAGNLGGISVLKHQSGMLTSLHCYAPAAVAGCDDLPDLAQAPVAVALDGGFLHAAFGGGGIYLALTTGSGGTLALDSGKIRCAGAGTTSCPATRPAGTGPVDVAAVDGTSYVASEEGRVVMAFQYPSAADLLDFTTAPKPAIKFGNPSVVGHIVEVEEGTWSPTPDAFTYTWRLDGTPVPGEHDTSFHIPASAKGKRISVQVTAMKSGYASTTRTSASTDPVLGRFTDTPLPTISGLLTVGETLTAHVSWTPQPTKFTYTWIANSHQISGEHQKTLKLTDALWGKRIAVGVRGSKSGYDTLSEQSNQTVPVVRPFTKTPTPTITGTAKVGHTLTAHHGTWQPAPAFNYQWFANGDAIPGATHSTYAVKQAVMGKRLTVRVQGKKPGYRTTAKTSAKTPTVG